MINNSKILTVSYGTFSCTLEGFEDSFGTMKAIAEYFRDLAEGDRYFGAEPPQPDAEMLARIAQKDISRRVAAREQDGQIVLSALDEDPVEDVAAPSVAPAAGGLLAAATIASTAQAEVAPNDLGAEAEVPQTVVAETTPAIETQIDKQSAVAFDPAPKGAVDLADEDPADNVMVDLTDTAEPVSVTLGTLAADDIQENTIETEPTETAMVYDEADLAADTVQTQLEADTNESILAALAENLHDDTDDIGETIDAQTDIGLSVDDEDVPDIVPGQPDAEVEAFFSATDPAHDAVTAAQEAIAEHVVQDVPSAPAPDSIAAKLQRIRAVVSQKTEAEPQSDYSEDEHAEASKADPLADAGDDRAKAFDADDSADAMNAAETAERTAPEEVDELSALLSRVQDDQDAPAPSGEPQPEPEEMSAEDSVSSLFEEEIDASSQEPTPAPARARVIKVKRADLEAAIEKGDLEEVETADSEPEIKSDQRRGLDDLAPAKRAKTTLSKEDEDDLTRELLALEDDIKSDQAEPIAEDDPDLQPNTGRAQLPALDAENNADVNRLLAESDHHMEEPGNATRRDAFAHLRAAVAARNADATIEEVEAKRKGDDAYREDLAEVVRPRRPVSTEARTERPANARPAPLKLVAEQRVDVETAKATGAVRPRRVATAEEDPVAAPDGESFADFAEEMGAHSLPDMLEAAAAYMSFVEGHEQFSRPQLMTKVRQAGGDEAFSREEGLRSFGQLLRTGKIEKIKGGRFTVSDDIGFRPDERAAG